MCIPFTATAHDLRRELPHGPAAGRRYSLTPMKRRMAIVSEGLLSRLSFGLISFSLPLYARHLGLSLKEVVILAALNSAVAVGLKPLLGWAADRFGLKRTYLAAISLRSLVSLPLGFASQPWELFSQFGARTVCPCHCAILLRMR